MEKIKYEPVIITGPSGAGKTALVDYITLKNNLFEEAIGVTTREKRENETAKMQFIDKEEFERLIKMDKFIEFCQYNGNYYGTCKTEFLKLNDSYVIFNVGYSSAKIIKETFNNSYMIYLLPPTNEELIFRLGDRNYERYILGMKETIQNALKYEYLLISKTNDFETIYNDFIDIIEMNSKSKQKRMTLLKNRDFVKSFYEKGDILC